MKKKIMQFLLLAGICGILIEGCGVKTPEDSLKPDAASQTQAEEKKETEEATDIEDAMAAVDKDALALMKEVNDGLQPEAGQGKTRNFYEVFVYSFYDSDGDGIGDLNGLTQKLDYINDGKGNAGDGLFADAIWLMPIMPSPSYHKYDVLDYYSIDSQYGTMDDFKNLVAACDERGIDVIIDLVMNHTSSQHEWFTEASRYLEQLPETAAPDLNECPYVDYYHFIKEEQLEEVSYREKYHRIGTSQWYYEGQFYDGMPDLNLESEAVRQEFEDIAVFWMNLGVSGFRLDAVGEYETGNVEESIAELKDFVERVKAKNPDCYLVGEIWKDMATYTQFYQSGIDSCFNFAFADSTGVIANTIKNSNGYTASSYGKAQVNIQKAILENNERGIDAPFYSNHDIARSAGYYAGDYSEAQTKMAHAMNLFMSGNTFLYYGEELGMKGSGKDENKRAPMYWSDEETEGICAGPPNMDSIKMKYKGLDSQEKDGNSIYQYIRQIYRLKNVYPQIAGGMVTFIEECSDERICTVKKEYEGSEIAIVYNISNEEQQLNISGLTLNGKEEIEIGGVLLTGGEQAVLSGSSLVLPSYSVVILK